MTEVKKHNHITRDIKPLGACPACDEYHNRNIPSAVKELKAEIEKLNKLLDKAVGCIEFYKSHADCSNDSWICKCSFCTKDDSQRLVLREIKEGRK